RRCGRRHERAPAGGTAGGAAPEPAPADTGRAGRRLGFAEGHRPPRGARSGTRADLPHAAADALEPARGRRDPRHQLQTAPLQDQGRGARQSVVMAVLNPETFEFVLANELKRAVRSQNFVTLVMIQPRSADRASAVDEIARLLNPELRETDLLAVDTETVWMV